MRSHSLIKKGLKRIHGAFSRFDSVRSHSLIKKGLKRTRQGPVAASCALSFPDQEGIETYAVLLFDEIEKVRSHSLIKKGLKLNPQDNGVAESVRSHSLIKKGLKRYCASVITVPAVRSHSLIKKGLKRRRDRLDPRQGALSFPDQEGIETHQQETRAADQCALIP